MKNETKNVNCDGLTFGETKTYQVQGKIRASWSSVKQAAVYMSDRLGEVDLDGRTVVGIEMQNGWMISYYSERRNAVK
tara:strand:- start:7049 stop:7282 length:234 start_codon:yes stop_codon:yes gene_type:complete